MNSQPEHWNPYRVSRAIDPTGPTLTRSQQRLLWILVEGCPDPGMALRSRAISEEARKRLGAVMLVLRKLEEKRLVTLVDDAQGVEGECRWAPTLLGHARLRPLMASPDTFRGPDVAGCTGHGARVTITFTTEPSPAWPDVVTSDQAHVEPELHRADDTPFAESSPWPAGDGFIVVDDVFAGVRDEGLVEEGVRPLDLPLDDEPEPEPPQEDADPA